MKKINEQINRIKNLINVISENNSESCYPSDYTPGKKYPREILAKIFCCFAGENNFPYEYVLNGIFPKLPPNNKHKTHYFNDVDPKNIQIDKDKFVDMEEYVKIRTKNKRVIFMNIRLTPDMIHDKTLGFLQHKRTAPNYQERVYFQIKKAKKCGIFSLTETEPFILEYLDGKYAWVEGWHRLLAMIELYNKGEINAIEGKAFVCEPIK